MALKILYVIMQNMDVGNTQVLYGKLIASKTDIGNYTTYVFQNLDSKDIFDKYIMCVRFPNWECPKLQINDVGFVKVRYVVGGQDKWYDKELDKFIPYKFTDIHFLDFIFDKEKSEIVL